MKRISILSIAFTVSLFAQSFEGDWSGTLETPGGSLRLDLSLARDAAGTLKATIVSVDQGNAKISASAASAKEGQLSLEFARLNSSYKGTLAKDGASIEGISGHVERRRHEARRNLDTRRLRTTANA